MNISIRLENENDFRNVENIIREAFWDVYKPGCVEHLIVHKINVARTLGYKAIIIFGNPNYYHRFGFENAEKYNIQTSWGANFEVFMVLELYEGSLKGISGKYYEDSVFEVDDEELNIFEKQFPYKEKHITDTQL